MFADLLRRITYATPAFYGFSAYGITFVIIYKLSVQGYQGWEVMLPGVGWSVFYALCSFVVGRLVSERNAAKIIQLSGVVIVATGLISLFCHSYLLLAICRSLNGLSAALYAVPSQILIKRLKTWSPHGGTMKAASTYVVMAGLGIAAASAICANIGLNFCMALAIAVGVVMMTLPPVVDRCFPEAKAGATEGGFGNFAAHYEGRPNLVVTGWILAGLLSVCSAMINNNVPFHGVCIGFSEKECGNALAFVGLTSCITAFLLARSRYWMYRASSLFAIFALLLCALLCFGFLRTAWGFYLGGALFGIAYGAILCYATFHGLVHLGKEGRYASINESVIGVMSLCGLGVAMTASRRVSATPFYLCTALALMTAVVVIRLFFRQSRKSNR